MINMVVLEGAIALKPVLLEGLGGVVTEFNLEHSELSGSEPLLYVWRCKAKGKVAQEIAERAAKGQLVTVQGKMVQESVKHGEETYSVVKLLVTECAFGRVRAQSV
jgi:single-stranded DNA-binding protein